MSGAPALRPVRVVAASAALVEKGNYRHFMEKEIYEQPEVLEKMLAAHLKEGGVELEGLGLSDKELRRFGRIKVVACGTAYHAGLVGRYVIEELARVPVEVVKKPFYKRAV